MNIPVISFNSGEVTSKLDSRVDVAKYGSSCRSLKNFLPLVYGCVERRPGTKFIFNVTGVQGVYGYGTYGSGKYGE